MRLARESVQEAGRIAYVDGLRAVAALSVFVFHVWSVGRDAPAETAPERALQMGAHGVDLFFILSGFCLAYPSLRALRTQGAFSLDLAGFFTRRLVRILPPYYFSIAVFAIGYALLGLHSDGSGLRAILEQIFFFDRNESYLNPVYWTLAIEARWYLLFPILLAVYVKNPRLFGAIGLGALGAYYLTRANAVDIGTLPSFMLGIWAADIELRKSPIRRLAPAVFIPCAIVSTMLEPPFGKSFYAVEPVGLAACFAFVVWCGWSPWLRRVLGLRAMVGIGIASYSIYLFHYPALEYTVRFLHLPRFEAALWAAAFCATSFALFERPFLSGPVRRFALNAIAAPMARLCAALRLSAITASVARDGATVPQAAPADDAVAPAPIALGVAVTR